MMNNNEKLLWFRPFFFERCSAFREKRRDAYYWGRCELRKNHIGHHALERGMDIARWSTDWTA